MTCSSVRIIGRKGCENGRAVCVRVNDNTTTTAITTAIFLPRNTHAGGRRVDVRNASGVAVLVFTFFVRTSSPTPVPRTMAQRAARGAFYRLARQRRRRFVSRRLARPPSSVTTIMITITIIMLLLLPFLLWSFAGAVFCRLPAVHSRGRARRVPVTNDFSRNRPTDVVTLSDVSRQCV